MADSLFADFINPAAAAGSAAIMASSAVQQVWINQDGELILGSSSLPFLLLLKKVKDYQGIRRFVLQAVGEDFIKK